MNHRTNINSVLIYSDIQSRRIVYYRKLQLGKVGRDSSVDTATHYGLDGPRIESEWEARFSAPVHTGPGAQLASYTIGTGSLPGDKGAGEWR